MVKVIISYQDPKRFTAKLTILMFVDFLEQGALVPSRTFEFFKFMGDLGFRRVKKTDFQLIIGFRMGYQILQSSPCCFHRLEFGMMKNRIDLSR
ncbi:hypothetical protein D9M71_326050 [compost metagenome]